MVSQRDCKCPHCGCNVRITGFFVAVHKTQYYRAQNGGFTKGDAVEEPTNAYCILCSKPLLLRPSQLLAEAAAA